MGKWDCEESYDIQTLAVIISGLLAAKPGIGVFPGPVCEDWVDRIGDRIASKGVGDSSEGRQISNGSRCIELGFRGWLSWPRWDHPYE